MNAAASGAPLAPILAALVERDPARKCALVAELEDTAFRDSPRFEAAAPIRVEAADARVPGRPDAPTLLHPREVPTRGLGTLAGRLALAHAVAHIEFNAINLALDAVWRFRGLPPDYYRDWISVAQDEARHFTMLRDHLRAHGSDYGALPAHNGLWEAAEKTAHDPLARMACVPRVLEARGLDVTPGMIARLREARDAAFANILEVILAEEIRHVAIGTRWFRWLCARSGRDPQSTFANLLTEHGMVIRPPINLPARRAAGFDAQELALVQEYTGTRG